MGGRDKRGCVISEPPRSVSRFMTQPPPECQKDTLGFRTRLAWGRRRQGPNLPAPEIAPIGEEGHQSSRYPLYEIFDTHEQAATAAAIRNQGKDIPAPPLPPYR
jgi:hypothetical protein